MPPHSAYCLTWVPLTLDVGYLLSAAPVLRSRRLVKAVVFPVVMYDVRVGLY